MRPAEIEEKVQAVRERVAATAFEWRFDGDGSLVEVWGSGVANGHHFTGSTGPIHLKGGTGNPLLPAVEALEQRLLERADAFHRALPHPTWTRSQEMQMSYQAQVDEALAQYKGMSLQALSLGPDKWNGFIEETGLTPGPDGAVVYRNVPVTEGISGIKYIVG